MQQVELDFKETLISDSVRRNETIVSASNFFHV